MHGGPSTWSRVMSIGSTQYSYFSFIMFTEASWNYQHYTGGIIAVS